MLVILITLLTIFQKPTDAPILFDERLDYGVNEAIYLCRLNDVEISSILVEYYPDASVTWTVRYWLEAGPNPPCAPDNCDPVSTPGTLVDPHAPCIFTVCHYWGVGCDIAPATPPPMPDRDTLRSMKQAASLLRPR